jgi:SAM-dependent methyltransferase
MSPLLSVLDEPELAWVDPVLPPVGWDHPETARAYETFCRRHARYRKANRELVRHASLSPGLRYLDLAAGTGRTAEAVLPALGPTGRLCCIEPAAAMHELGQARLAGDERIAWRSDWPDDGDAFDRILCGAALWQFSPMEHAISRIARHLAPGGALVFNIPSLYLGEPDLPGSGDDPNLVSLVGRVAARATAIRPPAEWTFQADIPEIERMLREAGLTPQRWRFRVRITQRCLRDWMKIPVLSDHLLPDMAPLERAAVIDAAFAETDAASWKWERWTGWTAWKR